MASNNWIELKEKDNPYHYMVGKTLWFIGNSKLCGKCKLLKSNLEILCKNCPEIDFVYWDINNKSVENYDEFKPLFYPYIKIYCGVKCIEADYTSRIDIINELINDLLKYGN